VVAGGAAAEGLDTSSGAGAIVETPL